ncbi:SAM-dependent methyltransferase [Hoeflea prorocentri]|uniref:Class I SAM-dependent methyltransferase n=1 Tax=Hoeflea prorocentri TaxID=1922333 RepID=A0A9X3UQG6_9HYPH|nr:class I SAM-dependent methyltransferase [Hoeflea prorocentri]MCY6383494.1 class I SAM-dependent methyltransferase [Hoeflea prorocentri]MDA5401294.1 class I SAM-dependent methyltransferase [Hoeflea prorocentri]
MPQEISDSGKTAEDFWEDVYGEASPISRGRPGLVVERFTKALAPGHALDMGCAKGDDAVWLAKRKWTVVAVDISSTALAYAAENARREDVSDRISFEQYDLANSFPAGSFNLVLASFFHSPVGLPRAKVFRRAAASIVSGGHLLIIEHGSRAPWSWAPSDTQYPTAEEAFQELDLDAGVWEPVYIDAVERVAKGPDNQEATVRDNVVFLRRL